MVIIFSPLVKVFMCVSLSPLFNLMYLANTICIVYKVKRLGITKGNRVRQIELMP